MKLVVKNRSYLVTEAELTELFQQYGTVTHTHMVVDRETGASRGFAFVDMPDANEAENALVSLHCAEFANRQLLVERTRSGPTRLQSRPRRGGRRW